MAQIESSTTLPEAARFDSSLATVRLETSLQVLCYAACVRSLHEMQVLSQLQERETSSFLPVYRSVRSCEKELEEVLIPGLGVCTHRFERPLAGSVAKHTAFYEL